jgi:hypothetical protein
MISPFVLDFLSAQIQDICTSALELETSRDCQVCHGPNLRDFASDTRGGIRVEWTWVCLKISDFTIKDRLNRDFSHGIFRGFKHFIQCEAPKISKLGFT